MKYTKKYQEVRNKKMAYVDEGNGDTFLFLHGNPCLLYTSPSPRDLSTSRMPSSA